MDKPKFVRDVMTREVITLYEEDNLVGVEEGMQRYRFRHLPVVDDGKLVGLVTHRDILRITASNLELGSQRKSENLKQGVFVRDVMRRDVITIREDATLAEAGKLLWDNKLGCLPVVKDDGALIGIITEADFVKLALELLERT